MGGGFADGHPGAGPTADGEPFKDVVVVGTTRLAAGGTGGAVLQRLVRAHGREGGMRTLEAMVTGRVEEARSVMFWGG